MIIIWGLSRLISFLIKSLIDGNDTSNSDSNDNVNSMTVMIIYYENNPDFFNFHLRF